MAKVGFHPFDTCIEKSVSAKATTSASWHTLQCVQDLRGHVQLSSCLCRRADGPPESNLRLPARAAALLLAGVVTPYCGTGLCTGCLLLVLSAPVAAPCSVAFSGGGKVLSMLSCTAAVPDTAAVACGSACTCANICMFDCLLDSQ